MKGMSKALEDYYDKLEKQIAESKRTNPVGKLAMVINKPWESGIWGSYHRIKKKEIARLAGCAGIAKPMLEGNFSSFQYEGRFFSIHNSLLVDRYGKSLDKRKAFVSKWAIAYVTYAKAFVEKTLAEKMLIDRDYIEIYQDEEQRHTEGWLYAYCATGYASVRQHTLYKKRETFCHPNDEWNADIGKMVVLCHLYDIELPKWVYNKEEK